MQKRTYGYVRVSTKDQCEDRQLIALQKFLVAASNIFMDRLSGKNFNRPQYQKLMRRLKPHDVLVVKSIDRLGRNYDEILEQWRIITKSRRADIVVRDMPSQFPAVKNVWKSDAMTSRQAALELEIAQDTFLR